MNANSPEKSRPSGFSDGQMDEEKVRGFWQDLAAVFRWIAGKKDDAECGDGDDQVTNGGSRR
jgi:hypothetical protein